MRAAALRSLLGSVVALLVVTSAAHAQPTPDQLSYLRRGLDNTLSDYPSARFKDVVTMSGGICGQMNAKNRFGAYTGWTPFWMPFPGTEDARTVVLSVWPDGVTRMCSGTPSDQADIAPLIKFQG